LLDAGSTLLGKALALQSEGRVIVAAMDAMGYDAMAVGSLDLLKGLDVLLARAKEASFPILSCNLVSAESGEPLLQPYAILERGGIRYGILGVSEPDLFPAPALGAGAKVLDPVASVREYLPEVRDQSDVVILLSHLGLEEDQTLAQAVPGIDIVVGGRSRKLMADPVKIGNTLIVQAGYNGEWLGRLDVDFDAQGQVVGSSEQFITLDPTFEDDAQLKDLLAQYEERYPTPTPRQGS